MKSGFVHLMFAFLDRRREDQKLNGQADMLADARESERIDEYSIIT